VEEQANIDRREKNHPVNRQANRHPSASGRGIYLPEVFDRTLLRVELLPAGFEPKPSMFITHEFHKHGGFAYFEGRPWEKGVKKNMMSGAEGRNCLSQGVIEFKLLLLRMLSLWFVRARIMGLESKPSMFITLASHKHGGFA